MREKINSNPVVQAAIIGLLAIAFAFLFMTRVMGGGSDSAEEAPPATTPTTPASPTEAAPTTDPAATGSAGSTSSVPTVDPTLEAPGASTLAPGAPAFKAGPGLPEAVVEAHEDGQVVVVLAYRVRGEEDGEMKGIATRLRRDDVAVFKTQAAHISDYSRIATGLDIDRVPAMVVIRPKRFDQAGLPQASVAYGLRSPTAAAQAVRDAAYRGPDQLPYHPR